MTVHARARVTDPDNSKSAAASVSDVSLTQARILALFFHRGDMTDAELSHEYGLMTVDGDYPPATDQNIRSRRAELVTQGRLVATDRRAYSLHGRRCTVWSVA